jgi:hypothetical protein
MTTTTIRTARRPRTGRTTYHRDRTVTVWDVYQQQWRRLDAADALRQLGPTLTADERERMARHA